MKNFFAIFIVGLLAFSASAETLTGGNYEMNANPSTAGGGTLQDSGGNYTLQDSKGDPLGGKMEYGGYIFVPGILPWGMEEAAIGSISGKVTRADTGANIEGAMVIIEGGNLLDYSDAQGNYTIPDVPAGTHKVIASMPGFISQDQDIILGVGEAKTGVNFSLSTIPAPVVGDNGQIQQTWIERGENGVVIHWVYADPNVTAVDIWQLATPFQEGYKEYDRPNMAWTKITTVNQPTNSYSVPGVLADGQNYYFRAIPQGATPLFGQTAEGIPYNAITVGKIDLELNAGLNLLTMPLILTSADSSDPSHIDTRLETAMEGQLVSGDDFYSWNGTALVLSSRSGNEWSRPDDPVNIGNGFWINTVNGRNISLVGIVPYTDFQDQITAGLNLIGFPYPVTALDISTIGFETGSGDDFYYWSAEETALKLISNSAGWPTDNANLKLMIGKGNWYNTTTPKTRTMQNPASLYQE